MNKEGDRDYLTRKGKKKRLYFSLGLFVFGLSLALIAGRYFPGTRLKDVGGLKELGGLISILSIFAIMHYADIRTLEKHGVEDLDRLVECLLHGDKEDWRVAAAKRLGELRIPASRPALTMATNDPQPEVRQAAQVALEGLPPPGHRGLAEQDLPAAKATRESPSEVDAQAGSLTVERLGELMRAGDVGAIEKAFHYAADWRTREWAVTALMTMVSMEVDYDLGAMERALRGIVEVCEAEVEGGSYRTNCLQAASKSLRDLPSPLAPGTEEPDRKPASEVTAQKEEDSDIPGRRANEKNEEHSYSREVIRAGLESLAPQEFEHWKWASKYGPLGFGKSPVNETFQALNDASAGICERIEKYGSPTNTKVYCSNNALVLEEYYETRNLRQRFVAVNDQNGRVIRFWTAWLA